PVTPAIYTLPLHDALPIWFANVRAAVRTATSTWWPHAMRALMVPAVLPVAALIATPLSLTIASTTPAGRRFAAAAAARTRPVVRSEEHTSELQSRENLVCR